MQPWLYSTVHDSLKGMIYQKFWYIIPGQNSSKHVKLLRVEWLIALISVHVAILFTSSYEHPVCKQLILIGLTMHVPSVNDMIGCLHG